MTNLTILEQCSCVHFELSQWSGGKTIRADQLDPNLKGRLPPSQVARAGTFQLVSQESLRPFNRIKTSVRRMLNSVGVRFMGGWAIPTNKAEWVKSQIDAAELEIQAERRKFGQCYRVEVDAWLNQWGTWGEQMRPFVPDESYVESRFKLSYGIFAVGLASGDESAPENEALIASVKSLGETLFEEVAQVASGLFEESISGKDKVGQKAVTAFVKILDKLEGMQIATNLAAPLVAQVKHVLADLPQKGYMEGQHLAALSNAVLLLSDAERAKTHASKLLAGSAPTIYSSVANTFSAISWGESYSEESSAEFVTEPVIEDSEEELESQVIENANNAELGDYTPFEAFAATQTPAMEPAPSPLMTEQPVTTGDADWGSFTTSDALPVADVSESAVETPPLREDKESSIVEASSPTGLVIHSVETDDEEPSPSGPVAFAPFGY